MKRQSALYGILATTLFCAPMPAGAAIGPITAVDAGENGAENYILRSITVGDYKVQAQQLVTGTSTGSAAAGTVVENADDFDLNTIVIRTPRSDAIWRDVQFGEQEFWRDTNGAAPDFFIFEVGMNDPFSVQAILPGDVLGAEVLIAIEMYGTTGLNTTVSAGGGQEIGGVAFASTDLLDPQGSPLAADAAILGLQVTGPSLDPARCFAVASESVPAPLVTGIALVDQLIRVTFEHGELHTAPAPEGDWMPTGNSSGEYSEPIGEGSAKFYRVVGQ